jgi:heptosyltransferase III
MAAPRVLVIRGGAIGDFILTLPAIRLLKDGIPNCHLEVLGYPGIADLALTAGLADHTRSLGHRHFAPLFAPGAPVKTEIADYLASFNLVVSYLFDPDGYFRGNLERLGVKTLIECPHRILPGHGPAATQLARPLEKIALFLDHPAPHFPAPPNLPAPATPTHFILHPGSGSTQKTWPLENWLSVLQSLAQTQPLHIVLITGEAEADRGLLPSLQNLGLQNPALPNLTFESWHQIPLPDLVPRLQSLAHSGTRFLGHDSGISHLAAACGLPCTLLFGPTDPTLWAPQNPHITLLTSPTENLTDLPPQTLLTRLQHP